ncbi:MAG: Crp/Fnr family transcriptional regulator [Gemmatimonadaceae bacterium]
MRQAGDLVLLVTLTRPKPALTETRDVLMDEIGSRDGEDALHGVITGLVQISEVEWTAFRRSLHHRNFAPREHLVLEGDRTSQVYFIVSGLVRIYYNEDGRELVRGFDYEGRFTTAFDAVLTGEPAVFSIQALEPTFALAFSGNTLQALYERHPCWDRFGRRILEAQFVRQSDKERRFRIYDAEAHYRELIARKSPLIDRVPLNQLASFLRVTPETLSRIRRRINKPGERILR